MTRLLAAWLLLASAAAQPGPDALAIRPDTAQAGFTVHALGFWPFHGQFGRFDGVVQFDPAHPGACSVSVSVDLASLHMADPAMQADVLSANLLDVADYPALLYRGTCDGAAVDGIMTLHGQSHPLRLRLQAQRGRWVAEGRFRRAEWGITGRPMLAGPMVEVRFSVARPY